MNVSRTNDPRIGTVLAERYRVDALLGEGGMGKVYAAEHVLMRKRLAVKVLHRELSTVPEVVARFEREAMAAAHIEHPNIAAATDFGKLPDGAVFLVLEFVQGKNLRDEIAPGPMPVARALHIGRQIASALASAHELRIVHRDLKPENIMLVERGGDPDFVKVLDFGIAKVPIGASGRPSDQPLITRAGMVFGTPEYMAPEQALGQTVDGRADLYALGVIVYEMISGVRPFSSKSQVGILGQQLATPPPPFRSRAPGIAVPAKVEAAVLRLLEKEASERYQTGVEVAEVFGDLLAAPQRETEHFFTRLAGSVPGAISAVLRREATMPADPSPSSVASANAPVAEEAPGLPPLDPIGQQWPRVEAAPMVHHGVVPNRVQPWQRVVAFVNARRASLPPPMRDAIARVPASALLAVIATVSFCFVIVVIALVRSLVGSSGESPREQPELPTVAHSVPSTAPEGSVARVESVTRAAAAEIEKARHEGLSAMEALVERHPRQAELRVLLAQALVKAKKMAEATEAVRAALEIDPKQSQNGKVAAVLFQTAQSAASTEAAFALLEGRMGARGADVVYDLAQARNVRAAVRARAEAWLDSAPFQVASSPELNIAVALKSAKTCQQKYALLLRAKNVGDERSLAYIKPLSRTSGCGPGKKADCWACLRKDTRLADALSAIQARARR